MSAALAPATAKTTRKISRKKEGMSGVPAGEEKQRLPTVG